MVYFECQKCNETVKKPKLAKHLQSCGSHFVSCIDCSKVFAWDAFESHTSCISEAQKYQGNLYQAKEKENKGQAKQDSWVENVEAKIADPNSGIAPQTKSLLEKLLGFNNIPRKQKPFGNFVQNSLKIWDQPKIDAMWAVIASANSKPPATNGGTPTAESEKTPAQDGAAANGSSKWTGWKRALDDELAAAGGSMPWKRLRESLVKRCQNCQGANGQTEDELVLQALACIPESYCSDDSPIVKLPGRAV